MVQRGRRADVAEIIDLLKNEELTIEEVSKRLSAADDEKFRTLVMIASLEKTGRLREARRMLIAMLARNVGLNRT